MLELNTLKVKNGKINNCHIFLFLDYFKKSKKLAF